LPSREFFSSLLELAVGGEVLVALASRDVDLGLSFRQIAPRERLGQDRFRPRDNLFAPQFQDAQERSKQTSLYDHAGKPQIGAWRPQASAYGDEPECRSGAHGIAIGE